MFNSFKTKTFALVLLCSFTASGAWAGFAAIAYNSATGAWGESHGTNLRGVQNTAVSYCGAGCSLVAWTTNGCVALATNPVHQAGWSWGARTKRAAIHAAMRACAPHGGCTLQTWACH